MQRILFLGLLLLVLVTHAHADDEYRLRSPSPQDYLDSVSEVLGRAEVTYSASWGAEPTLVASSALVDEINWRFLNQDRLTYRQLDALYRTYVTGERHWNTPQDNRWLPTLISLWLRENAVDLNTIDRLAFDDYRIDVEPLYLSSQSMSGAPWAYFLHVVDEPGPGETNYVAVPIEGGYILPELPAPINSTLLQAGDLNGDGDPDIAYLDSTDIDHSHNAGHLTVASLRDDNRFELTEQLYYLQGGEEFPPSRYNWWFTPADEGGKTNLIQNQVLDSNWYCTFVQTTAFAWNDDDRLVSQSVENTYSDTFGCLALQAEQAMWAHDYTTAIPFYEQALETEDPPEDLIPYVPVRLGLAYVLTGQMGKADDVFSELASRESDFAQAVAEAYERDPRMLPVCQTVYNYAFYGDENLQSNGELETYNGSFNRFEAGFMDFDLENATCDLAFHLEAQLHDMTFTADASPLAQIEALGLAVAGSIETDFDGDGNAEWLIWLDAPGVVPLLFSQGETGYQLTRPELGHGPIWELFNRPLRQPTTDNRYHVVVLPSGEPAIVDIDFGRDDYLAMNCAGMCAGGPIVYCESSNTAPGGRSRGTLSLWRWQDGELVPLLLTPLCGWQDLTALFGDETDLHELHAAKLTLIGPDEMVITPVTYTWSDEAQTYVLSSPAEATPTPMTAAPTEVPTQQLVYTLSDYDYSQLRAAFGAGNYESVIDIVDAAFAAEPERNAVWFEPAFRYYRAMALEALGRQDDALAEYVTIFEAAPESSWGILAALHLDVVKA